MTTLYDGHEEGPFTVDLWIEESELIVEIESEAGLLQHLSFDLHSQYTGFLMPDMTEFTECFTHEDINFSDYSQENKRRSLPAPVCGNGSKEGGENCDDGNTTNGDGCSSACAIEAGYTCNTSVSPNTCI